MELAARRLEPANSSALRREVATQFKVDAIGCKCVLREAGAARENDHGSEAVRSADTSWGLGHHAGHCSSDTCGLLARRASRTHGQRACRPTEPRDRKPTAGRRRVRILLS